MLTAPGCGIHACGSMCAVPSDSCHSVRPLRVRLGHQPTQGGFLPTVLLHLPTDIPLVPSLRQEHLPLFRNLNIQFHLQIPLCSYQVVQVNRKRQALTARHQLWKCWFEEWKGALRGLDVVTSSFTADIQPWPHPCGLPSSPSATRQAPRGSLSLSCSAASCEPALGASWTSILSHLHLHNKSPHWWFSALSVFVC